MAFRLNPAYPDGLYDSDNETEMTYLPTFFNRARDNNNPCRKRFFTAAYQKQACRSDSTDNPAEPRYDPSVSIGRVFVGSI
jgi:hypothetical protein